MATFNASADVATSGEGGTPQRAASGVLMALFFAIGFLTCLNDIIIPHFKALFELSYTQAMLVQFAFFTAYFVISPPAGFIIRKLGYKRGIIVGLLTAAAGCIGFFPAAEWRSYYVFLGALFILASGFTILQVAANPYVAILGTKETASSRLTLTQAFNSLGTTIAPLVGSSVKIPYVIFALTLVAMSVGLGALHLPDIKPAGDGKARSKGAWSSSVLVFGAIGIFVYVGAEVTIGSFLVSFLKDPSIGGIDEKTAARCVSFYWGGAMVGRFLGSAVLRKWPPGRVLATFALAAGSLAGLAMVMGGSAAMVTILAVGLFNSIMFPTIFTLGIDGLGDDTGQGSGILCMAIVGGALLPVLQGYIADHAGLHVAFVVPVICYAYISWYGFVGSVRRRAPATAGAQAAEPPASEAQPS